MKLYTSVFCLSLLCFVWRSNARSIRKPSATDLIIAAKRGDGDLVSTLIEQGANVNGKNKKNNTALSSASKKGHVDVVSILLEQGAKVDQKSTINRHTALLKAAENGHADVVSILLEHGAKVDQINANSGCTALTKAAENGHADVVSILLENGAEIDHEPPHGFTPLTEATGYGYDEGFEMPPPPPIEYVGPPPPGFGPPLIGDGSRCTPLLKAAENGHADVVSVLLENGAEIDNEPPYGITPLIEASRHGHVDVVLTLLERGAEIDRLVPETGNTALLEAAQWSQAEVVSTLLAHGANINHVNAFEETAFKLAYQVYGPDQVYAVVPILRANWEDVNSQQLLEAAIEGDAELVLTLIDSGENINSTSTLGYSALALAVRNGNVNVVSTLLDHGAEIFDRDLNEAAKVGHAEIVIDLLAHGANVNGGQYGQLALASAAENGHADVVDILLANGVDINNLERPDEETALVFAARAGHADVVSLLIKNGADMSIRTPFSGTALINAVRYGHTDVVSALLAGGADADDEDVFSGLSALMLAARNGDDIEMLSTLLDHGADINKKTSMPYYSSFDPNTPKKTALDIVMGRPGSYKCKGKETNTNFYDPQHCLTARDKKAIISFLKEHGAKKSSQL